MMTALILISAGLLWRAPIWWAGPLASLALPILIPRTRCRWRLAFLYFASGSFGLVPGAGVFFGHGSISYVLGAGLWLASAAALALPWIFATTPRRAIIALLIDAVPPLGLFGWLSPLAAAGVLFPGFGLVGIALLLLGVSTLDHPRRARLAAALLALVSIGSQATTVIASPAHHSPSISGVTMRLGQHPGSIMQAIARNQKIVAVARRAKTGIVVLPETITTWLPGTAHQIARAIPHGKEWLVGATTIGPHRIMADSIVAVRHEQPGKILFRAVFPVPVSMWHPWKAGGYRATWRVHVRTIGGRRAVAVICYDQLLPWVWAEAAADNPSTILATRNDWWARGTGIPVIQRNTSIAWARMIGARLITATNW